MRVGVYLGISLRLKAMEEFSSTVPKMLQLQRRPLCFNARMPNCMLDKDPLVCTLHTFLKRPSEDVEGNRPKHVYINDKSYILAV